jgi:hypothetical protein
VEIERETLLELQNLLMDHLCVYVDEVNWICDGNQPDPGRKKQLVALHAKIVSLSHRCLAREAAEEANRYTTETFLVLQRGGNGRAKDREYFSTAQRLISEALRRDPLVS